MEDQLAPEEKKQKNNDKSSSVTRKKQPDSGDNKRAPKREPAKTFLMWLLIAVVVVLGLRSFEGVGTPKEVKMTYTQFQEMLANPEIKITQAKVIEKGLNRAEFHGELQDPASINKIQSHA